MPQNNNSSNTNSGKFGNSGSSSKPSQSAFIKESWGTRENFQHSYGLKMEPSDIEEGNRILAEFEKKGAFEKKK
ncbi:hypothetical protein HDK77DRAFT_487041 [Phyllosticta capitalensis]|uniref:Uncharacterized protein n=1 Tax=Phyllosticta capitalensis TaxID=121624 RepID=A0ABR1YPP9_9PEZI